MRRRVLVFCLFIFSTLLYAQETTFKTNGPDDYREGIHAFVHATIWIDYQTCLNDATLIISRGVVTKVGKDLPLPKGAMVHDMAGRFIYPAFIDLFSNYGMPAVQSPHRSDAPQMETNRKGAYGWNQAIHTDFKADDNFIANDKQADQLRESGFGAVLTNRQDGIARGTGVVVTLANQRENKTILQPEAAAFYSFSKGTSTQDYPSSLMGIIALLRQTYYDARWYAQTKGNEEYNISLREWNREQSLPQIFDATYGWQNILRADKIGDEFGVQYIIKSSGEAYERINEVKNTRAKLIVPLDFPKAYDVADPNKAQWVSLKQMKEWELAPTNCAALAKAGIDFAITSSDLEKPDDFLPALRRAVHYGLDSTIALKSLTFNPATFLNIYDKIGSLQPGKAANFFITSKPLFDDQCKINENWVQGIRYAINPFPEKDIRGQYALTWRAANASTTASYTLDIGGTAELPKAKLLVSDSSKPEVKIEYHFNSIHFSFRFKEDSGLYLFTGIIDDSAKLWSGKAQTAAGDWLHWEAKQIKAAPPDTTTAKADTTDYTRNLGSVIYPFGAYGYDTIPQAQDYLIKNGTVWTNEDEGNLTGADVLIRNGKIASVGKGLSCADCKIIDATGKYVTSGVIDEHSHIAISEGVNEGAEASSAEVRIGDVINCEDIDIYRQLASGVVAAQLLHGSANPIGGQSALIKFRWGYPPEKMKIAGADGFIKFALGENVKQSNWGDQATVRYPQTRMGVEQTYWNYFTKAREYEQQWKDYENKVSDKRKGKNANVEQPRRNLGLDALDEVLNSKRFITCHSYVQSEITMLMHVADTFGFRVNTFTHVLEGYKIADKLKAHGANASTFADWWDYKYEVIDAIPYNAAILTKMGINTAVNSDDAEMGRRLNQEAAKTIKYGGLSEEQAWKLCTLNPAKMLHLDTHMGSLKAGKDADVVVWSDNPLSIYARCEKTFVDGILFYDADRDAAMRDWMREERARLTQKMLAAKKAGMPTQMPKPQSHHQYTCNDLGGLSLTNE